MRRHEHGFTLIELLVVIAIIVLLLATLMPSLAKVRELTRRAVCAAQLHDMAAGAAVWSNRFKGNYPCFFTRHSQGQPWEVNGHGCYRVWQDMGGPDWWFWPDDDNGNERNFRGHGVLAGQDIIHPQEMYCPSWTYPWIQYQKVNLVPPEPYGADMGGSYWPEKDMEIGYLNQHPGLHPNQRWMQTSYAYRGTFTNSTGLYRGANVQRDSPSSAFMADHFADPYRGLMLHHIEGFNVAFIDGHAGFVRDKTGNEVLTLMAGAGTLGYGYARQEEVFRWFGSR